MNKKIITKKKLYLSFLYAFFIVLTLFFSYFLITGRFSLANEKIGWDGVSIATSFSGGNGTKSNPFLISNAEEFLYFKRLIESDDSNEYNDKYYELTNDIDLGENDITSIGISVDDNLRIFKGNFNGNGNTIKKFKISNSTIIDNKSYYSLFSKTEDAYIYNLNINDFSIVPSENNNDFIVSLLVGDVLSSNRLTSDESNKNDLNVKDNNVDLLDKELVTDNVSNKNKIDTEIEPMSVFKNISVNNFFINLPKTNGKKNVNIISNLVNSNIYVKNVYLKGTIQNNDNYTLNVIGQGENNIVSNIVTDINSTSELSLDIDSFYKINDNKVLLGSEEVSMTSLLTLFNADADTNYSWIQSERELRYELNNSSIADVTEESSKMFSLPAKAPVRAGAISEHASGIVGDTIYINDLESDFNYYKGQNYIDTDTYPDGTDLNLYNSNNLVKVHMLYDGSDINDSNVVGRVSTTERVSKFIYYKYYVVKDGYVDIELIDNPFANRPNRRFFNGWATDYEGATILHNADEYVRTVHIPVSDVSETISITMHAIWTEYGKTANISSDDEISDLYSGGMRLLGKVVGTRISYDPPVNTLYIRSYIGNGVQYPNNAVNASGARLSGYCSAWFGGCTYYYKNDSTTYNSSLNYYSLVNGSMRRVYPIEVKEDIIEPDDFSDVNVVGFFKKVTMMHSNKKYYDKNGNILSETSSCNDTDPCFELMQYYDDEGNINYGIEGDFYYELVTRDINIIYLDSNSSKSVNVGKPLTLTGINNGSQGNRYYSGNISANADLRIEHIEISKYVSSDYDPPTSDTSNSDTIFGNNYNLKIGRGVTSYNSYYQTADSVIGGANNTAGSSSSYVSFRLIVESGKYNTIGLSSGTRINNLYINATGIYGNDFDRISGNNTSLNIYYCASGAWGGTVQQNSSKKHGIALTTIVKSGTFGNNESISNNSYSYGIYVGGRDGGEIYSSKSAIIEGGIIYNIVGGPLGGNEVNDTFISVKGGTIYNIFGGAGRTETEGNRLISVTGGNVLYGVFGGSNGVSGNNSNSYKGTLNGSSFIYIGGKAIIGDDTLISGNRTIYGIESGSVFGAGNGNRTYENIGSVNHSTIVIADDANIKNNVYAGGNYGTVGIFYRGNSKSKILIKGGTIGNSVYGGGNLRGGGKNGYINEISIKMLNGNVVGSIYGGSRSAGVVYGNTTVEVYDGNISNDVYGGGEGSDTYVSESVNVVIGSSDSNPKIAGNVYGGSALGTVNATEKESNDQQYNTNVTINSGEIVGNVYGGGKGSLEENYIAYLSGNTTVNIKGGTINNVFGGSKDKGIVYGKATVNVTNGTIINDIYGGGEGSDTYVNKDVDVKIGDSEKTTSLKINNVYGGSAYGTVNSITKNTSTSYNTSVEVNRGTITSSVFGGAKGSDKLINPLPYVSGNITVTINGGNIGNVYGGFDVNGTPRNDKTDKVYLKGGIIGNVFGGGNNTGQKKTEVYLQGSEITSTLYGGSNQKGDITDSNNVEMTSGSVLNIFGGNNIGGKSEKTIIKISGGSVRGSVYGGALGSAASVNKDTSISIKKGSISKDVYGGGLEAPVNTNTNIVVDDSTKISGSVYGGGDKGSVAGNSTINISDSTVEKDVYGGGVQADVEKKSEITINKSTVKDSVYGGGKSVTQTDECSITLNNSVVEKDVYGGSNQKGDVEKSKIIINNKSNVGSVYGGNNIRGKTSKPYIEINDSTVTGNVFGGGNQTETGSSEILINSGTIGSIYGGGNSAGLTDNQPGDGKSNILILSGNIANVYGGSNFSGLIDKSNVVIGKSVPLELDVEFTKRAPGDWPSSNKPTYAEIKVRVKNRTNKVIDKWYLTLNIPQSEVFANDSPTVLTKSGDTFMASYVNKNYGSNTLPANGYYEFKFSVLSDIALNDFNITGSVSTSEEDSVSGDITIGNVYGGGNVAAVGQTYLDINNAIITGNVFGGGDKGTINENSDVFITDTSVHGNVYGGGNAAYVLGNTSVTIDGMTEVGTNSSIIPESGCVFGSGNAAGTGKEGDSKYSTVNLSGGKIHGNVYGGARMATVNGSSHTNIGTAAINNPELCEESIVISDTVFGGSETSVDKDGNPKDNFNDISVTKGINININGFGYVERDHDFIINGSIFGSGNGSSAAGDSEINIRNLGEKQNPNKAVSIQRANTVNIYSSSIELFGSNDRTDGVSGKKYSFNQIKLLRILDNTTLLLHENANFLEKLYSGLYNNGDFTPAVVDIDADSKTVTKNVDNRIYMIPGQPLNISMSKNYDTFGKITGMTFFGIFDSGESGYTFGLYDSDYKYGDTGNIKMLPGGSYVDGLHSVDHDITKDGFYTNYLSDDGGTSSIVVNYIEPTDLVDGIAYRWNVGYPVEKYSVELIATRFSSMGTNYIALPKYTKGNVIFNVTGFDSTKLTSGVKLVDSNDVPRVGKKVDKDDNTLASQANNTYALSMKAETQEWTGYGTTKFLSNNYGEFNGNKEYRTDSRKDIVPRLMFYLYHPKNITYEGPLGTSTITLTAAVQKDDLGLEYDITYIVVDVTMTAVDNEDLDGYDASITYDKKYELPADTPVNITNQSQFTAYFALAEFYETFEDIYGINNSNFHVLTTSTALPVNTMITMLDYGANHERPNYYYYKVNQDSYNKAVAEVNNKGSASYYLRDFIFMDSVSPNNTYDDKTNNRKYYDSENQFTDEDFIFIFDFKETSTTGTHLNNNVSFELRNSDDISLIDVNSQRNNVMYYSTYDSSNVVLEQKFAGVSEYLYYNIPFNYEYSTEVNYNKTVDNQSIIDTNYESSRMGINVSFIDNSGEQVRSSLLVGTSIFIGDKEYFADGDGIFRIKLADKVSSLIRNSYIVVNKDLPSGEYKIRYTLFASEDGLHNSTYENYVIKELPVSVVSSDNYISVDCDDKNKVVDGDTGLNMSGSNTNYYTVKYSSQLSNPNFRINVYKRAIDNESSTEYIQIPFMDLFSNYFRPNGNGVFFDMDGLNEKRFSFRLKDRLVSGTYKVSFELYDNNQLIDQDISYVIVKKKVE